MRLYVTRRSQISGSHFSPTKQELIRILHRKSYEGKSHSCITDMNVYEKVPWLLQHVSHFRSVKNEWYYFVTKSIPKGIKKQDSTRSTRTVAPGFTWKGNTKITPIEDKGGDTIGYLRTLTFLVKDKALDKDKASGWVMQEFLLDNTEFQELVLCRIRFYPDKDYAHEFAPRLAPIVIGQPQPQPQPPREEADKKDLCVATDEKIPYLNVPVKLHQGVDQQQPLWTGSCPSAVFSYPNGQYPQFMNMEQYQGFGCYGPYGQFLEAQLYYQEMVRGTQGMMENQDFGSYAQYWGGALAQDHLPLTHQGMEPAQQDNSCFDHNVFENIAAQQQQQQFSNFTETQQGMMDHQDFGYFTQFSGGNLAQNHLPLTHQSMEPEQQDNSCFGHNVFGYIAAQQQPQYLRKYSNFSETQQGIEPQQHDNSCFGHNVVENQTVEQQQQYLRQDSNFSVTQQDMMEHQDLTQNHQSVVPMETQQGIEPQQHDNNRFGHNVVENQITEPPYSTQEQNQPLGESDETADFGDEELEKLLGELDETAEVGNWDPELEDMANFGDEEWAKVLGENTPEEEAELVAELGNCNTTASLLNYFFPV